MEGLNEVSLEPSLLQTEQAQLPQSVMLQPSEHLCGSPLNPLQQLHILLVLGSRIWVEYCRLGLTKEEQRGQFPPCSCWQPLWMQPRILLVFWAASAHCWFTLSHTSTRTLKSFFAGLLSRSSPSPYIRIFLTQLQHPHLALLNLTWFTWAHFSSLFRSP